MINYKNLFVVSCVLIALTIFGLLRLQIDTDVVRSLPTQEKSIADGIEIFEQHPIHDQIAIDISLIKANPDRLVEIGKALEEKLEQSGFFAQVGTDSLGSLIPELALYAAKHLPLLFTEKELKDKITPLLEPEQINQRLQKLYQELSGMEGIGQAEFMGLDPLGLKDLVLARMAPLAPSLNSQFYQGSLLSKDGHHLLVTARPKASGTDTASARQISQFLDQVEQELTRQYPEEKIQLTPVGAYRAALDNEEIIRHDVNLALVLATLGIALLLYFAFPRPLTGLLAFVPALAGTGASLFIYSLLHSSISIMVLGFGGALISITVDHGIAYLLFLDRPQKTRGQEASREVRAIALMAVVTSVCAFLILSSSGFPVFVQLGQFTALGILFSYLFVHTIFPRLFPSMPPAEHTRSLPLRRFVDLLYRTGKPGAIAALLLFICLAFFAKPQFHVDLTSMNTMSTETQAADALFTEVWGNINERVILMRSVDSLTELQNGNDQLLAKVEEDTAQDVLAGAFVPSMLFPGQERAKENFRAWHTFWNDERVQQVQEKFTRMGEELGFAPAAFAPFFTQLQQTEIATINPITIPEKFYELLGIRPNSERTGLLQFLTLIPGKNYTAQEAVQRYGQDASFFDAKYFTARLAEILFSTFRKMLVIIALSIVLLLALFYLDLRQTLLTLLPPFFAYICTLGTLHLIGHPLDIPALMLSIVILGMGVDYSVFCVRAHQRYQDIAHPSYALVRTAVFMAGASTLIGFGVLCFAEHAVLRSIGIASFLGIGYSLLGTFLLLPPLLDRFLFSQQQEGTGERKNMDVEARVRHRYRTLEAYTRMFARFKLRYDPMFADLPTMLTYKQGEIKTVIDIGCGYGVPACWCLEQYPGAVVYGIDPDSERVRSATIAFAGQGKAICGYAPELPPTPSPADLVLLLDMFHYLDDETAAAVLHNSFEALDKNGLLVTRFVIRPVGKLSWNWYLEDWRIKSAGGQAYYRPANRMAEFMRQAGFTVVYNEVSAVNRELIWLTGKKEEGGVKE